jgi:hypothetical protein
MKNSEKKIVNPETGETFPLWEGRILGYLQKQVSMGKKDNVLPSASDLAEYWEDSHVERITAALRSLLKKKLIQKKPTATFPFANKQSRHRGYYTLSEKGKALCKKISWPSRPGYP